MRLDTNAVKQRAAGRWQEILTALGGIDAGIFDGKNHPCPRCGGFDRFRFIDGDAGALFCNQCFSKGNGDGIAALQWLRGWDFQTALAEVARYPGDRPAADGKPRIVKTYDYRDEEGRLLFQVCRMEPKDFRQRRPKPSGGWEWKVKGCRFVPYRLPELVKANPKRPVLIAEGEKDADRLAVLGCLATTNPGGAGKWRPEYNEHFRGRKVIILPDNDEPGWRHANATALGLHGIAAEVKVVQLPGVPEKGDVSDWLEAGGTLDQLRKLIESAPPWKPGPKAVRARKCEILPWQPFPVDALPERVRAFVTAGARAIGCDPAHITVPLLVSRQSSIDG